MYGHDVVVFTQLGYWVSSLLFLSNSFFIGFISRYNKRATSNAQRIQKWMILPADFSIPGGEIGPTMKVHMGLIFSK